MNNDRKILTTIKFAADMVHEPAAQTLLMSEDNEDKEKEISFEIAKKLNGLSNGSQMRIISTLLLLLVDSRLRYNKESGTDAICAAWHLMLIIIWMTMLKVEAVDLINPQAENGKAENGEAGDVE